MPSIEIGFSNTTQEMILQSVHFKVQDTDMNKCKQTVAWLKKTFDKELIK